MARNWQIFILLPILINLRLGDWNIFFFQFDAKLIKNRFIQWNSLIKHLQDRRLAFLTALKVWDIEVKDLLAKRAFAYDLFIILLSILYCTENLASPNCPLTTEFHLIPFFSSFLVRKFSKSMMDVKAHMAEESTDSGGNHIFNYDHGIDCELLSSIYKYRQIMNNYFSISFIYYPELQWRKVNPSQRIRESILKR